MGRKRVHSYWRRQVHRHHPVIGWWHVPNLTARLGLGGSFHTFRSNAQGLRADRDFPIEKPSGKVRIGFLGDSYTAGDGVSNHQRFSALLSQAHPGVASLNFGLNSSGTDQQLLIFQEIARAYQMDAWVWGLTVENIYRNVSSCRPCYSNMDTSTIRYRAKPWFERRESGLFLHQQPVPKATRTELATWKLAEPDGNDPYVDPYSQEWLVMRAIIEDFLRQVEGTPVFLLPLPLDSHYLGRAEATYQARFRELDAPQSGVSFVDVLPALKQGPVRERSRLRFPADPHYTALAHEKVFRVLEAAITNYRPELLETRPSQAPEKVRTKA